MNKRRTDTPKVRDRIVETAERLFYAEGIRAVGIDRIIAEAGVAKMSLYNHFPSKDDLILAVLKHREEVFLARFENRISHHTALGLGSVEAFFAALKDWFESPDFRGCMFLNAVAELADPEHPGCRFSAAHKERFREMVRTLVKETAGIGAAEAVAPAIFLLVEGAIVAAVTQKSSKPADIAREAALTLIRCESRHT